MSIFNPRGLLGVIGVMLALVALYVILEKGTAATSILGSVAGGALSTIGVLQGRNVSAAGVSVSGGPA